MIDTKLREKFANDIRAFADNKICFENFVLKYKEFSTEEEVLQEDIEMFFIYNFDFFRFEIQYFNRFLLFLECQNDEQYEARLKNNDLIWNMCWSVIYSYPLIFGVVYYFIENFQYTTRIIALPLGIFIIFCYYMGNYIAYDAYNFLSFKSFKELSQKRRACVNFKKIPLQGEVVINKKRIFRSFINNLLLTVSLYGIAFFMPYLYFVILIFGMLKLTNFIKMGKLKNAKNKS